MGKQNHLYEWTWTEFDFRSPLMTRCRISFRGFNEIDRAFSTLGLTPASSLADVRRVYRAKVRDIHPDRILDSSDRAVKNRELARINDAYRLLLTLPRTRDPDAGHSDVPSSDTFIRPPRRESSDPSNPSYVPHTRQCGCNRELFRLFLCILLAISLATMSRPQSRLIHNTARV